MVQLRPMSETEFHAYLAQAVPSYAQAHIEAGDVDPGEALALYEEMGYRIAGIGMTKVLAKST